MINFNQVRALALLLGTTVSNVAWGEVIYWENHVEPSDFIVQAGDTLILRGDNTVTGSLNVAEGGQLVVDEERDCHLHVGNIDVAGDFRIGSSEQPYSKKAVVDIACKSPFLASDERRKGVVVRENGTLTLFGAKGASSQSWTRLRDTAFAGTTCIPMDLPSTWEVGDEIVLSSTDFDPHQAEKRTIVAITPTCVEVDRPLQFMHYGHFTEGVDERGEIGLLSRSIHFRGCDEATTPEVGAHMIFLENFHKVQVEGVELENFGQGDQLGRYPMHFHLAGRVPSDTFLRSNSIHASNFRAIAIHGTQGVHVENNVAFNITGHAMMFEDGAESENVIHHNLVVLVKEKLTHVRLGSDAQIALSAFYITNPNNTITDNVVAGVEGSAYWIHTRLEVKGLSYMTGKYPNVHPFKIPLGEIRRNTAHSVEVGFKVDSPDLDALDYPQQSYSPAYTYMPDAIPVFREFVVHHSRQGGWFRGLRVAIDHWVVGDVTEGVQILTRGDTAMESIETYVKNSLFVGGTANRGNLVQSPWQFVNYLENRSDSAVDRSDDARMGIKLYDGPMTISNCTFTHWYSQPCLNVTNPAIGARHFNMFVMSTNLIAEDLVFDATEVKFRITDREADGGKTTSMVDKQGAVSGWNGATLLPDYEYYATPHCARSSQWGLACPHRYVNLDVVSVGTSTDPIFYGTMKIHRNNVAASRGAVQPSIEFIGQYIPASLGWLYHPIVSPGASYSIQFEKHTPNHLKLVFSNARAGDVFRIAVVYPEETQLLQVLDKNGDKLVEMKAMDDTECTNCYWYDEISTLLVIALQQLEDPASPSISCPSGGCWGVDISASVPTEAGVANDVADAMLPLLLVTDENDMWLNKQYPYESAVSGTADNVDWCNIDDPCLHAMDEGNVKMGILAFKEESCVGVGCFSSSCRYCKLTFSAADVPFPPCPFDPNYDGSASNAATNVCSAFASVGNSQAGVEVIVDTSCVAGGGDNGQGCINNQCRFCKTRDSAKSANFLDCSTFQSNTTTAPLTTVAPVPTTAAPVPTSAAPRTTTFIPLPETTTPPISQPPTSTTAPAATTTPITAQPMPVTPTSGSLSTVIPTTTTQTSSDCLQRVPRGDVDAGISASDDLSCKYGGLGCFSLACRFCKTKSTIQSSHLLPCSKDAVATALVSGPSTDGATTNSDSCWPYVSPGDVAKGLAAVTDQSCQYGGLGCFSASCRFCTVQKSSQTSPYVPCEAITNRTEPVLPLASTASGDPCLDLVSSGDAAVGISALTQTSCSTVGGVGCVTDTCQYCKTRTTSQSAHMLNCSTLLSSSPPSFTSRLLYSKRTLQVQTTPPVSSIDVCSHAVSLEENVAGIFGYTDVSCAKDDASAGVGCFTETCRYCRTADAIDIFADDDDNANRVENFKLCPPYVIASSMGSGPSHDVSLASCAASVSFGQAQAGISAIADTNCQNSTTDGCFARAPCRYCKYRETSQSASFPVCEVTNSSSSAVAAAPCVDLPALLGLPISVSAVVEPHCNAGSQLLPGCVAFTVCRVCRSDNASNSSVSTPPLPTCDSLTDSLHAVTYASLEHHGPKKQWRSWDGVIEAVVCLACTIALVVVVIHRRRQHRNAANHQRQRVATPRDLPRVQDGRRVSVALLTADADYFVL